MKTTIELPDDLVKKVKLHALHEGKKLKDAVADLLRQGLKAAPAKRAKRDEAKLSKDPRTGLLVFNDLHAPAEKLTPERIDEILLAQEVEWHFEACRQ